MTTSCLLKTICPHFQVTSPLDTPFSTSPEEVKKFVLSAPSKTWMSANFDHEAVQRRTVSYDCQQCQPINRSDAFSSMVILLIKKKGLDLRDHTSFRSITNISTISKIIERLILHHLKPQLETLPNYCKFLSAYWSGHLMEMTVLHVVNNILHNINASSIVALVSLNISVAFDMPPSLA